MIAMLLIIYSIEGVWDTDFDWNLDGLGKRDQRFNHTVLFGFRSIESTLARRFRNCESLHVEYLLKTAGRWVVMRVLPRGRNLFYLVFLGFFHQVLALSGSLIPASSRNTLNPILCSVFLFLFDCGGCWL